MAYPLELGKYAVIDNKLDMGTEFYGESYKGNDEPIFGGTEAVVAAF